MATDNKKYYWLKQKSDFFTQPQIKKLRRVAGGDTFTIIYQKIMLLSITDGGLISYQKIEETLEDELALILDEEIDNIKMTLSFMLNAKLLEKLSDTEYLVVSVPELIGSETSAAGRMRKLRGKCNNVTPELPPVTKCYTEKEKEIELDKEKSNKKRKLEQVPKKQEQAPTFDFSDFNPSEVKAINDWLDYKVGRREAYKAIGLKTLRTKLLEFKRNGYVLAEIVNNSIIGTYGGLFAPNQHQPPNKHGAIREAIKNCNSQDFSNTEF